MTIGTTLGPYRVIEKLGEGGMGEVYKARDTRLDRTVAIKILPDTLAADPQFRERFDREARTLSRFTHPNICTLYDVGEHAPSTPSTGSGQAGSGQAVAFLVMELLDGETLETRCARASAKGSGLPLDDALRIAIQMADALAAAHRQGIVHRDLKPGNIFLARSSGTSAPPIAKLLDFGLARTVSANGVLAHGPSMMLTTSLRWRDRGGAPGGSPTPPGLYRSPRLSPDQKRVAMALNETVGSNPDLWVLDLARGTMSRATSDPGRDWFPVWTSDGSHLFFLSNRSGVNTLFQKAIGEQDEPVADAILSPGSTTYPGDVSGDGRFLVFHNSAARGYDLGVLTLAGARKASVFVATPFNDVQGRFSPNGRWMAYASEESGRFEVYVRAFPAASGQRQISIAGGMQPEWRRDGKELFYISTDGKLTAVPVTTDGPTFSAGTSHALFDVEVPEANSPYPTDYAVTADGQRFLVNTVVDQPTRPALTVILNWTAGLKK